ncbi:hypothetical protein V500_01060 [Pseudogymnoascus sp. VKM F-4518 (FW-2643)]|nr:hypothetical protein V500_01060 [Pseudogymnoascus sp. VKM F-4518 (FW-2643)]
MPARKASNKLARKSGGIRKSASPKRTAVSLRHHTVLQTGSNNNNNNNNSGPTTEHPVEGTHRIRSGAISPPTTPDQATATPVFHPEIVTCVRRRVNLPGWGVNGWKLFTTKHILRVVEVKSEAEAVAARLAAALESERSYFSSAPAKPDVAASRPVSLRTPGCRFNHREHVAMKMV